jgi:hypothetical protein
MLIAETWICFRNLLLGVISSMDGTGELLVGMTASSAVLGGLFINRIELQCTH